MLRIAVIAIALWASLPAGVCQALCAPGEASAMPSCHEPAQSQAPAPTEHASDCSRCDHVVAPSYASNEVPTSPLTLAFAPAFALVSMTPALQRVATGAGPPGLANSPYRTANPPLLS